MIADDDDYGFIQNFFFSQTIQELPYQKIDISDLPIVATNVLILILTFKLLWMLLRCVGVIEVNPTEKSFIRIYVKPFKKSFNDFPTLPLN